MILVHRFLFYIGVFKIGVGEPTVNNTARTIDLTCKNNPDPGAPPYWEPPYDHLINPFPECVYIREYFSVIMSVIYRKGSQGKGVKNVDGKWYLKS